MKRWMWFAITGVLIVGGFLLYRNYQNAQAAKAINYDTEKVTKGTLTATVGATGTVRANQMSMLAWQTTGEVSQINVAVHDTVEAGSVLAELNANSLPQNIILAQADLVDAQRALDNLLNSKTASAQAELAVSEAQKTYDDADKALKSLTSGRSNQEDIDVIKADLLLAQKEVDRLQEVFNQYSGRPESDAERAVALSNLSQSKQRRDKIQRNLNWMTGSSSNQEITEAQAKLAVAKAQLEDAQREWERLKDGPDPSDISAAQARITALQASLNLARLTAPITGMISEVDIKLGDQVSPGQVAFRIDDFSHLLIDVPVSEVDINRIGVGQDATLTFDAIQAKEYHGKVIQVAEVGSAAEGVVNFNVTIELTDADEEVRPGMTCAVNVVVANIADALLVPNRAIRTKEGQRVVYILRNGKPEQQTVELGASSETVSQILSDDVKVGDQVILNPPSEFQSGGPSSFMGFR